MSKRQLVNRRLVGAAGALAAGVGGAQSLDAAVVQQNVDVELPADTTEYHIDFNGDTVNELDIQSVDARVKATDYLVGAGSLRGLDGTPANLAAGTVIGPLSGAYSGAGPDTLTGVESGNPAGNFQVSDGPGFIGVQFPIGANVHYGYVGYEGIGAESSGNGRVFSLAYESTPLTSIVAGAVPEPASLALLAAGAAGIPLYRRRRTDRPVDER